MSESWEGYETLVVETYRADKPGKSSKIHVRPVSGQRYPTDWDVECSKAMRKEHPVGTKFRIYAKETNREGGKSFLYSRYDWPYEVVE